MPLLDHFHPPLSEVRHWDGFHSKWANTLVDELNDHWLPACFFAEPRDRPIDTFEVKINNTEAGPKVVAAIELVSPANKDRAEHRRAFAVKCASHLVQGISLVIVDIVTTRQLNLHDEIVRLLPESDRFLFPGGPHLYTAAYRPVQREGKDQTEVWLVQLAVGQTLPTMPLALPGNVVLSIDLETTYITACRNLRLL